VRGRIKRDDGFAFLNKPYDLAGLQRAIDTVAPSPCLTFCRASH
jgi:hypothetical protein